MGFRKQQQQRCQVWCWQPGWTAGCKRWLWQRCSTVCVCACMCALPGWIGVRELDGGHSFRLEKALVRERVYESCPAFCSCHTRVCVCVSARACAVCLTGFALGRPLLAAAAGQRWKNERKRTCAGRLDQVALSLICGGVGGGDGRGGNAAWPCAVMVACGLL